MHKLFLVFTLILAMFFAVSCDSGIKFENPNDRNSDAYNPSDTEGETDSDSDETDTISENDDETDNPSEPDNDEPISDDSDSDSTPDGADSIDDSADSVPDESDSDNDSADSVPDDDSDSTDTTPDESDSTPDEDADTDTIPADPCNPNPCNGVANSTQICTQHNAFEFSCGCNSGYFWNGQKCTVLPECSATSGTPCKDSTSGLIWSEKAENTMAWQDAKNYCNNHTEGGFSWHLPNIDELRTIIKDRKTAAGGECNVS